VTPEEGGGVLRVSPPAPLRGLLEVRGLGLFSGLEVAEDPPPALRLTVRLVPRAEVPRLPGPAERWACGGIAVPAVALHAFEASAPAKVALALAAATGRARQAAGAFVRGGDGA
jgi:HPr kinase/phosphorylase